MKVVELVTDNPAHVEDIKTETKESEINPTLGFDEPNDTVVRDANHTVGTGSHSEEVQESKVEQQPVTIEKGESQSPSSVEDHNQLMGDLLNKIEMTGLEASNLRINNGNSVLKPAVQNIKFAI